MNGLYRKKERRSKTVVIYFIRLSETIKWNILISLSDFHFLFFYTNISFQSSDLLKDYYPRCIIRKKKIIKRIKKGVLYWKRTHVVCASHVFHLLPIFLWNHPSNFFSPRERGVRTYSKVPYHIFSSMRYCVSV